MTSFIDTHCHLDLLDARTDQVIVEARNAGVERIITISVDEPSLARVIRLIEVWPMVYGTAGMHPHSADEFSADFGEVIVSAARSSSKIVAIGEIGLDYHYMHAPAEVQQTVFREQLKIAEKLKLPVVLHSRDAEQDTLASLRELPLSRKGVAHSFTGSGEMSEALIEMGWYIGINGIVTFRNAQALREVVRMLPLERIVLETDAPYLSPVPFLVRPNAPCRVPVIAEYMAELLEVTLARFMEQTTGNAEELFALTGG